MWWQKELERFWGDGAYKATLDTRRAAKVALKQYEIHRQMLIYSTVLNGLMFAGLIVMGVATR